MGISNALSFAVVVILARPLGPADFGAYAALTAYGILLAIPAGAFQVVVARTVADPTKPTTGWRLAMQIGVLLAGCTVLASPWVATILHLNSAWAVILTGLTLIPMTVTGVFQGILLGTHRIGALSVLYIATAGMRVAAASAVAILGLRLTATVALLLIAGLLTAAVGWTLCRAELTDTPSTRPGLARLLWRSQLTLAAFVALTNVDVLLARQVLSAHDSGGYALAATFARALAWGTQFIALLVIPRLGAPGAARVLLRASALILLIGGFGLVLTGLAPEWWITLAGGSDYADSAWLVPWCVGVGTCWALAQVWMFSQMGNDRRGLGMFAFAAVTVEILIVLLWLRESATQILTVTGGVALAVAIVGLIVTLRLQSTTAGPPSRSGAVTTDRA